MEKYELIKLNSNNIGMFKPVRDKISLIGEVAITYDGENWNWEEIIYERSIEEEYCCENILLIDNYDFDVFPIFMLINNNDVIGMIKLAKRWNLYAHIDDLIIHSKYRNKGVHVMLLETAKDWALSNNMKGLSLETSNNNLIAFKCYIREGFLIGGIDVNIYSKVGNANKIIYMYMDIS